MYVFRLYVRGVYLGFDKGALIHIWLSQNKGNHVFPLFLYGHDWFFFWPKDAWPNVPLEYTTGYVTYVTRLCIK